MLVDHEFPMWLRLIILFIVAPVVFYLTTLV